MKNITQKQFLKYLKYTPYFIWHSMDELQSNDSLHEVEDSFRWLKFDEEDLMIIDFNYKNNYSLKDVKAARIIQNGSDDFLRTTFKNTYFIKSKNVDDAINETKEIINGSEYDYIINPVFRYRDAISRPRCYDKKNKCIYSQKFSASTKKKDWCSVFWNYVIAKQSVQVKDIKLIILSSGPNRKGELSFIITPTANIQVASPSFKHAKIEEGGLSRYCEGVLNYKSSLKSGQSKANQIQEKQKKTKKIFTFREMFILKQTSSQKNHIGNKLLSMNADNIIHDINKAKLIKTYNTSLKKEMINIQEAIMAHDNIKEILAYHKHIVQGISGSILNKKTISNYILNDDNSYKQYPTINYILKKKNYIDSDQVKSIIRPILNNSNRIVWYDFEGYSLPTATMDYFPPFQQTVFQVSIIETRNSIIRNKINKVYDPKILSGDSFADIINSIYSLQAEVYVVYNKNYENTRIKEMVDWLLHINHPFAFQEKEKAEWIMNRTVDLADLFATRNKNSFPPIFLYELRGMYSIKLLEKYIHNHDIQLPTKIYEYEGLEIQNGMMAMDIAIERALGILGDKKWNEKVEALKIYCENDVNAMIMVYELAKYLIR